MRIDIPTGRVDGCHVPSDDKGVARSLWSPGVELAVDQKQIGAGGVGRATSPPRRVVERISCICTELNERKQRVISIQRTFEPNKCLNQLIQVDWFGPFDKCCRQMAPSPIEEIRRDFRFHARGNGAYQSTLRMAHIHQRIGVELCQSIDVFQAFSQQTHEDGRVDNLLAQYAPCRFGVEIVERVNVDVVTCRRP